MWRIVALAAIAVSACDKSAVAPTTPEVPADEVREVVAPLLSNTLESSPLMALKSCGTRVEYHLTNIRYTAGTVTVYNDASRLYITYQISEKDWFITDTRLAVARSYAAVPQDNRHLPLPWSFPYAGKHEPPTKSVTYSFALSELGVGGGDNIVIAAMAGVVRPKTKSQWEWMVMWGIGKIGGESLETIYNYTITGCAAPPPHPTTTGGVVTLTFDDGWATTYTTAYHALKEFGFKGNVAVNPDPIDGKWDGYMTLAQLQELDKAGWSIVSHTLSHRDLVTLSDAELDRELKDSQAWVVKNGFGPSDVFIVPFHSWGPRERAVVEKYYRLARGYTVNQFVPALFQKVPIGNPYDLTGYESEFAPFTTADGRALTMEYVKRAVKEGEFIDLFFHKITPELLPGFRQLMTELVAYKSNIRTWAQISAAPRP